MKKKVSLIWLSFIWMSIGSLIGLVIDKIIGHEMTSMFFGYGVALVFVRNYTKKYEIDLDFLKKKQTLWERRKKLAAYRGFEILASFMIIFLAGHILRLFNLTIIIDYYHEIIKEFTDPIVYSGPLSFILMLIAIVILAPIFEEIIFRGVLYDVLEEKMPKYSILMNAVLFALMHGTFLPQHLLGGYIYSLIRKNDGDIYGCIILHGFNNLLASVQSYIPNLANGIEISLMIYLIYYLIKEEKLILRIRNRINA